MPAGAPAIGGQRFLDLAQGKEGVHYRRSKFELVEEGFIQNSGLKALSYQASGRTAITGGCPLWAQMPVGTGQWAVGSADAGGQRAVGSGQEGRQAGGQGAAGELWPAHRVKCAYCHAYTLAHQMP